MCKESSLSNINNHSNRILAFQAIALFILSGCAQDPNLTGKIVASYSTYDGSDLLVYEHGRLQTLEVGGLSPRWLEDGKTVVCVGGKRELAFKFITYPENKVIDQISIPDLGIFYAFLPPESKIVYSNGGSIKEGIPQNLHLYDRNMKTERQLTFYDKPRAYFDSVEVSPDGHWVVFAWGQGYTEYGNGKSEWLSPDVYRLDLETGKIEKLFFGGRFDLSADGKRLVYIAGGIGDAKFGTSDLVIYDFQTRQFTRLTNSKGMIFKHSPRFSPDGKWVAYIEEGAGPNNRSLVAVRADGSGKKITLIKPGYVLTSLDWGP